MAPVLSADGSEVAFVYSSNLVPGGGAPHPDVFVASTSSAARDADGDGLPDGWEQRFGLDAYSGSGANGADGDPDGDGVTNAAELQAGTHPRGFEKRYFAEGATIGRFTQHLAFLNPGAATASLLVHYLRHPGPPVSQHLVLDARSEQNVDCSIVRGLEDAEFSTLVESDVPIVVDRTMTWMWPVDGPSGTLRSSHLETAVPSPALTWYLAEGATHSGFDLFYLLQNPNPAAAEVEVTYLLPAGAPVVRTEQLPPSSRTTIWVDQIPGLENTDISAIIRVTNGEPIVVERAMYLSRPGRAFEAAHASAGITDPTTAWFLAEGATGDYFDLFVLIANPAADTALVRATYLLPDGTTLEKRYTIPGQSRFNIWVDLEDPQLRDTAVSTVVESLNGVPIIVERSMWWPGDHTTWHGAHNSPGATSTGTRWALAEGAVNTNSTEVTTDTFILVANTSPFAASIKVTLVFGRAGTAERIFQVGPKSRFNIQVSADFAAEMYRLFRFGTLVESLGDVPAQLVVERAMYSNAATVTWAAGANALATKLQ